jgi:predicted enzyme related to lactoylglutathione lyase
MARSISVSVDVPDMAEGKRFFAEAFGFETVFEPVPGVSVLRAGEGTMVLLEKPAGSQPSPNTAEVRRYERHWTPVHLDIHVEDLEAAMERAAAAGAVVEQVFENAEHGSAAFCADPFGHGFCLIERR